MALFNVCELSIKIPICSEFLCWYKPRFLCNVLALSRNEIFYISFSHKFCLVGWLVCFCFYVCPAHGDQMVLPSSQNKPTSGMGLCCDEQCLEAGGKADESSPH